MARGLNTILGTILLIGIALGAGASIFSMTNQFSIVGFSKTEYSVVEAALTKEGAPDNSQCFLFVKLMNTGTEQIASTTLEVSTDNRTIVLIPDEFLLLNEEEKSVDPGDTIVFDSVIFTNMTGQLIDLDPSEYEDVQKLRQAFLDNCSSWNKCQTYTIDVLGIATDSTAAISHILPCKESDRI